MVVTACFTEIISQEHLESHQYSDISSKILYTEQFKDEVHAIFRYLKKNYFVERDAVMAL